MNGKYYMTTKEVAATSGVSAKEARRQAQIGQCGKKYGANWLFSDTCAAFLKSRKGQRGHRTSAD